MTTQKSLFYSNHTGDNNEPRARSEILHKIRRIENLESGHEAHDEPEKLGAVIEGLFLDEHLVRDKHKHDNHKKGRHPHSFRDGEGEKRARSNNVIDMVEPAAEQSALVVFPSVEPVQAVKVVADEETDPGYDSFCAPLARDKLGLVVVVETREPERAHEQRADGERVRNDVAIEAMDKTRVPLHERQDDVFVDHIDGRHLEAVGARLALVNFEQAREAT